MIKEEIKKILAQAVKEALDFEVAVSEVTVERPKNESFGDFSSPQALVLGKSLKQNPLELAQKIAEKIKDKENLFSKVEVTPPGFINFHLSDEFLRKQAAEILKKKEDFGKNDLGAGKTFQVEFISANPTGPLTLGNGRGGVYGDILGNVLEKSGFAVTREYYVNDAGGQIEKLGHSILKDEQAEYRGDYIDELAEKIAGDDPKKIGQEAVAEILAQIKETVKAMGIEFDVWFSENKELRETGKVEAIFEWLRKKELAYEQDGALWFAAEKFGDEKDRPLKKSDGEPTYFGVDCAYHFNKLAERKFDRVLNIWGADHHGDVPRVKGFVESLGFKDAFEIVLTQFVRLVKDGQEVRMSKRKGVFVTVDEVLEEVGKDAFRFFMAMYSPNTHMDFDLALAKEQSQKNPVYYAQYGYARISSIKAKIDPSTLEKADGQNLAELKEKEESDLIRQLLKYPEVIVDTARDYQIQRVPQYALDLVGVFHKFYETCRVLGANENLQAARLSLIEATRLVLGDLLENVLGVKAPEKM